MKLPTYGQIKLAHRGEEQKIENHKIEGKKRKDKKREDQKKNKKREDLRARNVREVAKHSRWVQEVGRDMLIDVRLVVVHPHNVLPGLFPQGHRPHKPPSAMLCLFFVFWSSSWSILSHDIPQTWGISEGNWSSSL